MYSPKERLLLCLVLLATAGFVPCAPEFAEIGSFGAHDDFRGFQNRSHERLILGDTQLELTLTFDAAGIARGGYSSGDTGTIEGHVRTFRTTFEATNYTVAYNNLMQLGRLLNDGIAQRGQRNLRGVTSPEQFRAYAAAHPAETRQLLARVEQALRVTQHSIGFTIALQAEMPPQTFRDNLMALGQRQIALVDLWLNLNDVPHRVVPPANRSPFPTVQLTVPAEPSEHGSALERFARTMGERNVTVDYHTAANGYGGQFEPNRRVKTVGIDAILLLTPNEYATLHEGKHYHGFEQRRRGVPGDFYGDAVAQGGAPIPQSSTFTPPAALERFPNAGMQYSRRAAYDELLAYSYSMALLRSEYDRYHSPGATPWTEYQRREWHNRVSMAAAELMLIADRTVAVNEILAPTFDALAGGATRARISVDAAPFPHTELNRDFIVVLDNPAGRTFFSAPVVAEPGTAPHISVALLGPRGIGTRLQFVEPELVEAARRFNLRAQSGDTSGALASPEYRQLVEAIRVRQASLAAKARPLVASARALFESSEAVAPTGDLAPVAQALRGVRQPDPRPGTR